MSLAEPAISSTDREIVITRMFKAPPELVWRAWTDPAQIVRWWGPAGFTTTTHAMDVRPGGVWRFDMHGPDGRDYPNRIVFDEVEAPRRLVYTHAGDDDVEGVRFQVIVTFEKQDGGTKLTMRSDFGSAAERERICREYGAVEGGAQTVGRLAEHLGEAPTGQRAAIVIALPSEREIMIVREFAAPRQLVWKALTTPELVRRWLLGPPGWEMIACEIDLRIGGAFRYEWRKAGGAQMGMGGIYREIDEPERIVNSEQFDESWYEGEALVTQRLHEHAGATTLTLTVQYDSRAIRDGVLASPMAEGVAACYDRLAELVTQ